MQDSGKKLLPYGNNFDFAISILAIRNVAAVKRHPNPYVILRTRLIDDASGKYFVGQLTSAMV